MTPITYYPSRSSLIVVGSAIFIYIVLLLWVAWEPMAPRDRIPVRIFVGTMIFVFGAVLIGIIKQYVANEPILVIDSNGITDNASSYCVGFVPWSDITHVSVSNAPKNHKFLNLHVKNPEIYIQKMPQLHRPLNKKKPVPKDFTLKIPDVYLPVSADELLKTINEIQQKG